jgi:3'-phosphoadenosine 5'-phosphosulfate (PAPS) 3'-phosphatase
MDMNLDITKTPCNPLLRPLYTAIVAARMGGETLTRLHNDYGTVMFKEDKSVVCDADKGSSRAIKSILQRHFPLYGILDEEGNDFETWKTKDYSWIVDPLDGTIDYINNGKNYCVLIGLLYQGVPQLGVAYKPSTNELFYALKNHGAYVQNSDMIIRPLNVSKSTSIDMLVSYHRHSYNLDTIISEINPSTVTPMSGSIKIVEVAKGNYNLFIHSKSSVINIWDICAPSLILEEAGGKITDAAGKNISYDKILYTDGLVISNKIIHDDVIDDIRKIDDNNDKC